MEERNREDEDGCCALDFQESSCRGTLVFAMGSSRNVNFCDGSIARKDRQGSYFSLTVCLVFDQIDPVWTWDPVSPFPESIYEQEWGLSRAYLMMIPIPSS